MQELNMVEVEEVSGGFAWFAVAAIFAIAACFAKECHGVPGGIECTF